MLNQAEFDTLLSLPKKMTTKIINFPRKGEYEKHEVLSLDDRYQFLLDINRRNTFSLSKCGYQERYQKGVILVRLDLNGAPHTNPDGIEVAGSHIHIYRENYDDAWAYPLVDEFWKDTLNLPQCLEGFLRYCNIVPYPTIIPRMFDY